MFKILVYGKPLHRLFNNNSSKISKASLEKTEKKQDDIKYVLEIQNSNYVFLRDTARNRRSECYHQCKWPNRSEEAFLKKLSHK